jgi:hypothetical protein
MGGVREFIIIPTELTSFNKPALRFNGLYCFLRRLRHFNLNLGDKFGLTLHRIRKEYIGSNRLCLWVAHPTQQLDAVLHILLYQAALHQSSNGDLPVKAQIKIERFYAVR